MLPVLLAEELKVKLLAVNAPVAVKVVAATMLITMLLKV